MEVIIEFNDSPVSFTPSALSVDLPMHSRSSLALSLLPLKLRKAYFEADEA